jgi:hypothetical protein
MHPPLVGAVRRELPLEQPDLFDSTRERLDATKDQRPAARGSKCRMCTAPAPGSTASRLSYT